MRSTVIFIRILYIRFLRGLLVFQSLAHAIALRLPIRFASFPLLPLIRRRELTFKESSDSCCIDLVQSLDVIVSLYQAEKFMGVLKESLSSCFFNSKIRFHFVLVCGEKSEIQWLENLIEGTHHTLQLFDKRIGIYEAWNKAIDFGCAELITNLNADDFRIPHSLCSQAAVLQGDQSDGSFANFILTGDIISSVANPQGANLVSSLGSFSVDTLLVHSQNFMHCAPMWQRDLHDRFGAFDESLTSSGDTEFWLRSMSGGARFGYFDNVTTIYFHNPLGLSTSFSSAGRGEWSRIRKAYLKQEHAR